MKRDKYTENIQSQMRKGSLEFVILLIISRKAIYAADMLKELKKYELIVVEGTLYPLLNRLKTSGSVEYEWKESKSGPPRKYYKLTNKGKKLLDTLLLNWNNLSQSINALIKFYEKNHSR